jgi:hypothetical protein
MKTAPVGGPEDTPGLDLEVAEVVFGKSSGNDN